VINAIHLDGHWRVVDDHGRRYLPSAIPDYCAIGGSFVDRNGATAWGWDEGTRLTPREAALLAGVLRQLQAERDERERLAN
jgi:hypothetical protein